MTQEHCSINKFCWLLTLLFALASLLMAYTFLWQGKTAPASDGRLAILLEANERDLVLAEMRGFLQAVQGVVDGARRQDGTAVASAARRVGMAAQQGVPASLMGKLPGEFKMLGFDTHSKFDQLALDAEQLGDPGVTLEQLGTLMSNCVACHAAYRIDLASP